MDTRKWLFLLATVLFLGVLSPTEACRCAPGHLQGSFCNSDVVLKVKFLNAVGSREDYSSIGYKIKTLLVFKGSASLKKLSFIGSWGGTSCEYHHSSDSFNISYLITGSKSDNGRVSLSACAFIKRWSELSPKQIKGMKGAYSEGCSCQILPCSSPCTSTINQCPFQYGNADYEDKAQNKTCAVNKKGLCSWKTIE